MTIYENPSIQPHMCSMQQHMCPAADPTLPWPEPQGYLTNEDRGELLNYHFRRLADPSLDAPTAVSILEECDVHLQTLVFRSLPRERLKFSQLVLGEYSYLCIAPGFKRGDSTRDNFDKSPLARLRAIQVVFQRYLKSPNPTCPVYGPGLREPHEDYKDVKAKFNELLREHSPHAFLAEPATSLSPDRRSLAEEAQGLLTADSEARRAFVLRGFAATLTPSPREESSPEELIPAAGSSSPPVETKAPEEAVSPSKEVTTKPKIDVTPPKPRLVVTPAAARAMAAATGRTVTQTPDGNITCTIKRK